MIFMKAYLFISFILRIFALMDVFAIKILLINLKTMICSIKLFVIAIVVWF